MELSFYSHYEETGDSDWSCDLQLFQFTLSFTVLIIFSFLLERKHAELIEVISLYSSPDIHNDSFVKGVEYAMS